MTLKIIRKCLREGAENPSLTDIEHFHWIEDRTDFPGVYTQKEMYDYVHGGGDAFILDPVDPLHQKRMIITTAKTKDGTKYVRTMANGVETDDLLKLPDCEPV